MFEDLKARKALQQISPSLQALGEQLQQVEQVRDPIDRLVGLFDAVSRFNDKQQEVPLTFDKVVDAFRKANGGGKHVDTVNALETLQMHFSRAGRSPYGMNRTQPGEAVTADNVYLGDVFGRWTFTANHWREAFGRGTTVAKEDKQVIEGQAEGFVNSHLGSMKQLIRTLGAPK